MLTDNRNRAAGNVRNAFTKGSGNMGTTGCVAFLFDKKGLIVVEKSTAIEEDGLMLLALDAGAEDFSAQEDCYEILTLPEMFGEIHASLEQAGIPMISAEVTMLPQTETVLNDPDDIKKMGKLLNLLDDDEDVQNVYHNAIMPPH